MAISTHSLARASALHPWRTIAIWGAGLVVAIVLMSALLGGATTTTQGISSHPDSRKGETLLEQRLRGPQKVQEAVVIRNEDATVDSPAYRSEIEGLFDQINALGPSIIESGTNFYASQVPTLVSADKHATIIPLTMAGSVDDASKNIEGVLDIVKAANGQNGFAVYVSGNASVGHDFSTASESDLARGEMIGGIIALAILVLVFSAGRSHAKQLVGPRALVLAGRWLAPVIAALVPVLLAVSAIMAALGVVALIGTQLQFSFFVTNMITMMGLAVGIDYSLFILSRFREEKARGRDAVEAITIAASTASRAVLFSGMTVIIALLGMLIIPTTIFRSLASGAIFVVSFAILASLTLLPAVLRLLDDKVDRVVLPGVREVAVTNSAHVDNGGGFWDALARKVMRFPVLGVVAATTLLVVLAIPYFGIKTGSSGVSSLPDSFQSKKGFQILERDFAGGQVNPAEIVIDGAANSPAVQSAIASLKGELSGDSVFGPATFEANQAGDLGLLSVQMAVDPNSREATAAIQRLRSDYLPQAFEGVPGSVYVTGFAAQNLDFFNLTDQYTPIVFVFVLGLSFVLLMLVFRSLVVPAKAIVMNLLSVGAAYGLTVLVCQKGVGAKLLGFQQVPTIEAWLPLFLFSVLFGLSMDYHVFLLSRIRERYDRTGDNAEAVAFGLRSTGRLITGAALIMVAVFGGFAMGQLVMLQEMGFGLGVAVLIDATVIRSVLVPASMRLLGRANWWLPPVLNWLPRLGIEGSEADRSLAPEGAGGGS